MIRGLLTLLVCLLPVPSHALVEYYLDPDWTGTKSGTQAAPFSTIGSTEWTTINAALATQDVKIYCSAREAGSDTDEVWSVNVALSNKTSNPTGTLILDGVAKYNTNDSTPTWTTYNGSAKCRVQGFDAGGSATKRSNVVIQGFHIVQNNGTKGVLICGDNWLLQDSELENGAASSNQPLIQIQATSDASHQGASQPCSAMSNVVIQNNNIHDSWAEMIYVGAGGCASNDSNLAGPNCQGEPTNSNIQILNNTMARCGGMGGGQGDCIDMKAALKQVTIRGNDISASGSVVRAIVMQGIQTDGTDQQILIERNYIHDHTNVDDAAIAVVNSWGTPNGVTIRNNIFDTITSGAGVHIYGTQAVGVKLYNNTIYNATGFCLSSVSGSTIEVRNNACLSNNGGGAQVSLGGTVTSTHNAYGGTWSAACTSCVSGLTTAAFTNAAAGDFTLTSGSVLRDVGTTIASFSNDYLGNTRPFNGVWDIGAYEYGAGAVDIIPPAAPTNLRFVSWAMEWLVPILAVWHSRRFLFRILRSSLVTASRIPMAWAPVRYALRLGTATMILFCLPKARQRLFKGDD